MYQRILIAIDGSESSAVAVSEAVNLAKVHRSEVRIVHVVDSVPPYFAADTGSVDVAEIEKALSASGRRILETARATAAGAGVAADTQLLKIDDFSRRVADVLVEEARRWGADLIVAGTHGRRGLSHLFVGSVAEGIVRVTPVPVLLVRKA